MKGNLVGYCEVCRSEFLFYACQSVGKFCSLHCYRNQPSQRKEVDRERLREKWRKAYHVKKATNPQYQTKAGMTRAQWAKRAHAHKIAVKVKRTHSKFKEFPSWLKSI
jgi:hypothetical protein